MPAAPRPFRSGKEEENLSLFLARRDFLLAIDHVAPNVVDDLVRDVGPVHQAALDVGWSTGPFALSEVREIPEYGPLWTAVSSWATSHYLAADWLLKEALRHLWRAAQWHDTTHRLRFGSIGGLSYWDPAPNADPAPVWHIDNESEGRYLGRVRAYMDAVKSTVRAADWSEAPPDINPEHLRWLARHQVRGWSYSKIAKQLAEDTDGKVIVDVKTVRTNITRLSALLPLKLRPARNRPA